MRFLSSFSLIASHYDAFILDLWGVIHDGQNPYPGAKECLGELRDAGKKIVLLSNAPRRAATVAAVMERMGITSDFYDAIITSGEAAYQYLATSSFPLPPGEEIPGVWQKLGKYIYIGLEKDRGILEGLPYQETDKPKEAHFVLISHSFYDNQPEAEIAPLLEKCLAAGLPALCINPDTEVVRQTGEQVYCAGVVAANYAAKGGKVMYFGKPHAIVYGIAMKALGDIDASRILAVGDNLATDIAGARNNGLACALVTGGILKHALGEPGTQAYQHNCAALFKQSLTPDYVLPAFIW